MGTFQGWGFKACDEVCGKKRWRGSKGDTWWWNEEVIVAKIMAESSFKS